MKCVLITLSSLASCAKGQPAFRNGTANSFYGAELEAPGGITLENVRAIAETGVDRISIGSLTKDIKTVDLSMRFE